MSRTSVKDKFTVDLYRHCMLLAGARKFTGTAYGVWKQHIDLVLSTAGVMPEQKIEVKDPDLASSLPTTSATSTPTTATEELWAKGLIMMALSETIAEQYQDNTAIEILQLLELYYNSHSTTAQAELLATYHALHYEFGDDIILYCEKHRTAVSRLKSTGIMISFIEQVANLFNGLPHEFLQIKSQCEIGDVKDFNVYITKVREFGVSYKKAHNHDSAYYVGRSNNGTRNTSINNGGNGAGSSTSTSSGGLHCYNCGTVGHRMSVCPKPVKPCLYCKHTKPNHTPDMCFKKHQIIEKSMSAIQQYNCNGYPIDDDD